MTVKLQAWVTLGGGDACRFAVETARPVLFLETEKIGSTVVKGCAIGAAHASTIVTFI
jgi:hypothetical protein